jgi:hypothetical protein
MGLNTLRCSTIGFFIGLKHTIDQHIRFVCPADSDVEKRFFKLDINTCFSNVRVSSLFDFNHEISAAPIYFNRQYILIEQATPFGGTDSSKKENSLRKKK